MARTGGDAAMSPQMARGALDPLVERSRPVLVAVGHGLHVLGRVVQTISLAGVAGTFLLTLGLVRTVGWWGLVGVLAGIVPWRAWLVGHHAVSGSGLLRDPARVAAAVRASAGTGRQWLDQMADLRTAGSGRRFGPGARAVVGTGRSMWALVSPSVDGASSLRELAIWPKTVSGLGMTVACPVLFVIGLVASLVSLIG